MSERRSYQEQVLHARTNGKQKKDSKKGSKTKKKGESDEQKNNNQKQNSGEDKEKKYDKKKVKCYNCQKFGHYARDCWDGDGAKNRPKKNARVHLAEEENSDEEVVMLMAETEAKLDGENLWYLNSGCSTHMTGKKDWFVQIRDVSQENIRFANDSSLTAKGTGRVVLRNSGGKDVIIENVLYVPGLKSNLLSLGQLMQRGFKMTLEDKSLRVFDQTQKLVIHAGFSSNRTFQVKMDTLKHQCFAAVSDKCEWLWHLKFGHLNLRDLRELGQKKMVVVIPHMCVPDEVCRECMECKQTRRKFKKGVPSKTSEKLELIHSDICGPLPVETAGGSKYFITFTDDYTRMLWVYCLQKKSEAFEVFVRFKSLVENQCGKQLKRLRVDGGGEFNSLEFKNFCAENGIAHEATPPYTPQHNGTAERRNRTLLNMVRCMLKSKGVPKYLWGEAVSTAAYVLNRSPTKKLDDITPEEAWSGQKPDVTHMRVFGSLCYHRIPDQTQSKLDDKGAMAVLIGYHVTCGYKLFDPNSRKVIICRDVVIDESSCWNWQETSQGTQSGTSPTISLTDDVVGDVTGQQEPHEQTRRSQRVTQPPTRFKDYEVFNDLAVTENGNFVHFALIAEADQIEFDDAIRDTRGASHGGRD